jgi:hypothetical protein
LILGFYVSLDGKSADADNGIRDVMTSIDDPSRRSTLSAGCGRPGPSSWAATPTSPWPDAVLELIYAPTDK